MKKTILLLLLTAALLTACGASPTAPTHTTAPSTAPATIPSTAPATNPTGSTSATIPTESVPVIPSIPAIPSDPTEGIVSTVPESTAPAPTQPPAKENDTFGFSAVLKTESTVPMGKVFGMTVTTTNISGKEYEYQGSNRIVGAEVYFVMMENGVTYTIHADPIIVPRDLHHEILPAGKVITWDWVFSDYAEAAPGTYDLYFNFQGYTGVMEDFLTVTE